GIADGAARRGVEEHRTVRVDVNLFARNGHAGTEQLVVDGRVRPVVGRKLDVAEGNAFTRGGVRIEPALDIEVAVACVKGLAFRNRDAQHHVPAATEAAADQGADRALLRATLFRGTGLDAEVEALEVLLEDEVGYATHGVGTVDGRGAPADHLNTLDGGR